MTKNLGYKCECGQSDCDKIFEDAHFESGYEQCKHNSTWCVIHMDCIHYNEFFPIFYHKNFMIANEARNEEWLYAHPISILTLDKIEEKV